MQGSLRSHGLKLYSVADRAATRPTLGQWRFDAILCDADGSAAESVNSTVRWLRREQRAPIVVLASPDARTPRIAALEAGATELVDKESSPRLIALKLQRLMDLAADTGRGGRARAVFSANCGSTRAARRPSTPTGPWRSPAASSSCCCCSPPAPAASSIARRSCAPSGGRQPGGEPRRSADMHVCRIRRKLREAGATSLALETIHGHGYALRLRGDDTRTSGV